MAKAGTKTGREAANGKPDGAAPRKKGQRTRESLLAAGRTVFERVGFLEARVADIVAEAGVSHGTFYTYFDSKNDIFREVAGQVVDEMYGALDEAASGEHALELIHAANHVFVEVYERHAAILALIEQVAIFDEHFREMRLGLRRRLVRRVESALALMLRRGEAEVGQLDPRVLANVLAGMVDNFAYACYVLEEPVEVEVALGALDRIWARALGLRS